MKLNNEWKWMFRPHILERGRNYFREGRVNKLKSLDNVFFAEVNGTEDYTVYAVLDGDKVRDIDCNCPYSGEGYLCKHEAALLFELEARTEEELKKHQLIPEKIIKRKTLRQKTEQEIRQEQKAITYIGSLEEPLLSDLIERAIVEVPEFRDFITNHLNSKKNQLINDEDLDVLYQALKNQVTIVDLFEKNSSPEFFVEVAEELMTLNIDCVLELFDTFFLKFKEMFDQNKIALASELNSRILQTFDRLPPNYESYKVEEVLPDYEELYALRWADFLEDQELSKQLEFIDSYKNYLRADGCSAYFYEVLISVLEDTSDRLNKLIDLFKRHINLIEDRHLRNKEIISSVFFLRQFYKEATDEKLRAAFPDYYEFRIDRIKEFIERKEVSKAIDLINESRTLDKSNKELVELYTILLIEIYYQAEQFINLKEEILRYFETTNNPEKEYLFRLKEVLSTDEWDRVKRKFFNKVGYLFTPKEEMEFYINENMWEEVRTLIDRRNFFNIYFDFEEKLRYYFPEELKNRLIKEIDLEVNMYRINDINYLIRLLKALQFYPYGISYVEETVQEIKTRFDSNSYIKHQLEINGL